MSFFLLKGPFSRLYMIIHIALNIIYALSGTLLSHFINLFDSQHKMLSNGIFYVYTFETKDQRETWKTKAYNLPSEMLCMDFQIKKERGL